MQGETWHVAFECITLNQAKMRISITGFCKLTTIKFYTHVYLHIHRTNQKWFGDAEHLWLTFKERKKKHLHSRNRAWLFNKYRCTNGLESHGNFVKGDHPHKTRLHLAPWKEKNVKKSKDDSAGLVHVSRHHKHSLGRAICASKH